MLVEKKLNAQGIRWKKLVKLSCMGSTLHKAISLSIVHEICFQQYKESMSEFRTNKIRKLDTSVMDFTIHPLYVVYVVSANWQHVN